MSEDLPARLRAAIEQRQTLAEAATQGEWVDDGGIYVGHPMNDIVDYVYQDEDQAHIVANQPSTVLARCKADLALLDEHARTEVVSYSRELAVCKTCFGYSREEVEAFFDSEEFDHPAPHLRNLPYPCRTVVLLAEGYGIPDEGA